MKERMEGCMEGWKEGWKDRMMEGKIVRYSNPVLDILCHPPCPRPPQAVAHDKIMTGWRMGGCCQAVIPPSMPSPTPSGGSRLRPIPSVKKLGFPNNEKQHLIVY
jgi:hypothetical protein